MGAKWNRIQRSVFGWKGDKGETGETGATGAAGSVGETGAAGSPGVDGTAATITVGTVTTGAAGSSASVTNSGTSSAAVFDFTIPQGASGSGTGDMLAATYDPIIKAITGKSTVGATPDTTLAALWAQKWSEKFVITNPAAGYVSPPQRLTRNGTGYNFYFDPVGTVASTYINIFKGDRSLSLGASLTNSATTMTLNTALTFSGTPLCLIDANGTPEVVQLTAGSGTTSITIVRAQGGTTAAAHSSGGYILPYVGQVAISSNAPVTYDASGIAGTADDWICLNNTVANTALKVTATMKWVNR